MLIQGKRHTYHAEKGEADGGGTDTGDTVDDPNQTTEGGDGPSPEVEAEARKMGWTPKEEFRGDPEKWRDASEFLDRGRTMLPIMRKQVERQDRQIADLQKTITDLVEFNSKADKRAFDKALKELKEKQVEAVKTGDADAFVKVDEEIADLHKEAKDRPVVTKTDPGEDPEYLEWAGRNKWVETDKEAGAYATKYAEYLREKGDKRVGAAFLDDVAKAVKKEFPEKFTNPRRSAPGPVEGASSSAKRGGQGYADMPAEARAACDRMVRNGFDGKPKEAAEFKANFVKTFFSEES